MGRSSQQRRPGGPVGRGIKWFIVLLLILGILSAGEILLVRFLNPPFTTWMAWQWVVGKVRWEPGKDPYAMPSIQWRGLNRISPHLVRAVLAGEDQRFLSHHGFDLVEMQEAFEEMVSSRRMRGASTITMQAARTVFLWPSRNWLRKLLEAYYTVLMEWFWDKRRIMEVYLNTVDWGDGIVGAESAAKRYFQKPSSGLTAPEAAMLAAVLPNPHAWSAARPSDPVKERQRRILRDMEKMPSLRTSR